MKYRKPVAFLLLSTCLLVAFASQSFGQQDPVKKTTGRLADWTKNHVTEKVYLHTDKPVYAAGENIWFKAYLVSGSNHQLSELSRVLYIDLIDQADSVSRSIKLSMANGVTWGDFDLPDNFPAGTYRLRAYTNYMLNAGPDCFFEKNILIGNAINNNVFIKPVYSHSVVNNQPYTKVTIAYKDLKGIPYPQKEVSYEVKEGAKTLASGKTITDVNGLAQINFKTPLQKRNRALLSTSITYSPAKKCTRVIPVKKIAGPVDVQFFPESGELIAGISTKVAYKATGTDGLGVNVTGIIKDERNIQVAELSDTHLGMGYTTFNPKPNAKYTATLSLPDGTEITRALPDVKTDGYTLSIRNTMADSLTVRVNTSAALLKNPGEALVMIAQQNGRAVYNTRFTPKTGITQTMVAKSDFQTGIVQFTLFSMLGQPLCERLVFIQNPDQLQLKLSSTQTTYAPRQKMTMNLSTVNTGRKTVPGSFSVAVINEAKVPVDELAESTIINDLLFTSELKGHIEKPNYYFTNITDKTREHLDVLMLTQGYRHFEWKSVLNDTLPAVPVFKAERSVTISGIVKTSGGKAVTGGKVAIMSTGDGLYLKDTVTNNEGRFAFNNLPTRDSIKYIVQAESGKGKRDVEIVLDKVVPPEILPGNSPFELTEDADNMLMDYLRNSNDRYHEELRYNLGNHVIALKEIVIRERKNKPLVEHSNNLNGPGQANQIIRSDKLTTGLQLGKVLSGLTAGVVFKGVGDTAYLSSSSKNLMGETASMLVVIDGMEMAPPFALDDIDVNEVQTVEVLKSPEYTGVYGSKGGGGVLVITSKRGGEDNSVRVSPGIMSVTPKGFYAVRQFYSPKYDDPKTNTKIADLRTTAYWAPNLVTEADGSASFEFFNPDGKGTYRIVIEGIDGYGAISRLVYRYKVE